jgi:sugar phosphate isomerase/epimerase
VSYRLSSSSAMETPVSELASEPARIVAESPAPGLRLSAQENLVPGDTLQEKFAAATALGYHGIEVRSRGEFQFAEREKELRDAIADGVVISSACVDTRHFIGDPDPEVRRDARENLKSQLGVIARVGGAGIVAPASYGVLSKRLPPYTAPRTDEEDAEIITAALAELGQVAEQEGALLFLEPLNRYEDFILNSQARGADLIRQAGSPGVRLCSDLYHMNIEEDDPAQALLAAGEHVGHVHLSESNRNEPGTGHTDWLSVMGALSAIGYDGWLALECRPRAELRLCLASCRETVARAHAAVSFPGAGQ